jgi:subtilisin family serine protease
MPLRILDSDGVGDLWRIKDAILWASQHGAKIVNMSFGYPPDITSQSNTFLHDLVKGAGGGGVPGGQTFPELGDVLLIVVAAGNGGEINNGADRVFPAAERGATSADPNGIDDNLLSVGASTRYDKLSSFSTMANVLNRQTDRWVRTVAPGEEIISAIPGGRYGMWSGTSMSAPIVSGIAALVLSVRPINPPARTLSQVVNEIEESGYPWKCDLSSRNIAMETSRVDALCAVTNNRACYPERRVCTE